MSNLDREAAADLCGGRGFVVAEPVRELLSPRRVKLGETTEVRRLLPNLGRRMVGAWCFVDHYGPDDIADEPGMQVPPHPHMGLQTVSWLHEGEVLHRDSTGSLQTIRPARTGPDDLGPCHQPLRGEPARRTPAFCTARSSGSPCPTATGTPTRASSTTRDAARVVTAPGLRATADPRRARRRRARPARRTPRSSAPTSPWPRGADLGAPAGARLRVRGPRPCPARRRSTASRSLPGSMLYLGCGRTELPLRADVGRRPDAPGRRAVRGGADHVVELHRAHRRRRSSRPARTG